MSRNCVGGWRYCRLALLGGWPFGTRGVLWLRWLLATVAGLTSGLSESLYSLSRRLGGAERFLYWTDEQMIHLGLGTFELVPKKGSGRWVAALVVVRRERGAWAERVGTVTGLLIMGDRDDDVGLRHNAEAIGRLVDLLGLKGSDARALGRGELPVGVDEATVKRFGEVVMQEILPQFLSWDDQGRAS